MKASLRVPLILLAVITISYFHVFLDDSSKQLLMEEDSVIENIGALAFFLAA